jgi:hypothetical protein
MHTDNGGEDKPSSGEKRPICHIQYGGKAEELASYPAEYHSCLDPWLEKPRFPSPPVDVLLLLYLIVRQFDPQYSAQFEDSEWVGLIRKSEKLVWRTYYDRIARHLNKDSEALLYDELCDADLSWM